MSTLVTTWEREAKSRLQAASIAVAIHVGTLTEIWIVFVG